MANVKTYSKKRQGKKVVSKFCPNFKIKEFACNDGTDKVLVDKNMVYPLQYFREYIKKSVIINSAYRTPSYNRAIGGASQSYHIYGRAFDIDGTVKLSTITDFFNTVGVKGIIIYKNSNFVHIDSREEKYHADNEGKSKKFGKVKLPYPGHMNRKSKGIDVAIVQFKLMQLGYFNYKVSGYYTFETKQAVKKFQSDKGLEVNGHIDKKDWNKLF